MDCDFIFLAADSHLARMLVNAIAYQYLIPTIQLGSRIEVDATNGEVEEIREHVRLVLPTTGCLRCNQLISAARLQDESRDPDERRRNRYVDEVPAPSVITFNTAIAAQAATDFMLSRRCVPYSRIQSSGSFRSRRASIRVSVRERTHPTVYSSVPTRELTSCSHESSEGLIRIHVGIEKVSAPRHSIRENVGCPSGRPRGTYS